MNFILASTCDHLRGHGGHVIARAMMKYKSHSRVISATETLVWLLLFNMFRQNLVYASLAMLLVIYLAKQIIKLCVTIVPMALGLLLLFHSARQPVDMPIWVAQLLTKPHATETERTQVERACREAFTARFLVRTSRLALTSIRRRVMAYLYAEALER
jgi:hypothetical protein